MNTVLGLVFLLSGTLASLLMFHLWGYPYDKKNHKSAAPESLVFVHRLLGYLYIAIYVYLMVQMVPRLWTYQIELPARTVVHISCGFLIGGILLIKLAIVRFFKHLESQVIPFLGIALLLCTFLLSAFSFPFALRESFLSGSIAGSVTIDEKEYQRVSTQLKNVGIDSSLESAIVNQRGLTAGRNVLSSKCVVCHDLRTVLARPRSAKNWFSTVQRMAAKSEGYQPIDNIESWQVTAYLIAISPDLQESEIIKKEEQKVSLDAREAIVAVVANSNKTDETDQSPSDNNPPQGYSIEIAKNLFELRCFDCHNEQKIAAARPSGIKEATKLIEQMVGEGLEGTEREFEVLIYFLGKDYVPSAF